MCDRKKLAWIVVSCAVLCFVLDGHAQAPPGERGPDDPLWVQWMRPDSPDDQTILHFFELYTTGELEPEGVVDLGTMLFHRGFHTDAVRMYRQALRLDPRMAESWFRIGLVKNHLGEYDDARSAYKKCLKIASSHGWCAFYLALLEEKTGHPSRALELYQRAFESAPELADAAVNPELLQSRLYLGALLMVGGRDVRPVEQAISPPEPGEVASALSGHPSMQQVPSAGVAAAAAADGRKAQPSQEAAQPSSRSSGETPAPRGAAPTVATVSPEASLAPFWPRLPEWILALI